MPFRCSRSDRQQLLQVVLQTCCSSRLLLQCRAEYHTDIQIATDNRIGVVMNGQLANFITREHGPYQFQSRDL